MIYLFKFYASKLLNAYELHPNSHIQITTSFVTSSSCKTMLKFLHPIVGQISVLML